MIIVLQFEQTQKKVSAGVLLAKNAATIGTNLSKGDFSASKNEQPLRKVANAKFDYFTVFIFIMPSQI